MAGRTVILMGSPRRGRSTSRVFAHVFAAHYQGLGGEIVIFDCSKSPNSQSLAGLQEAMAGVVNLGISFPLYVDSLPSQLLEWLYVVEEADYEIATCFAMTQCGYPFTENMDHGLAHCRLFARSLGAKWLGGLAYGGGVLIDGQPISIQSGGKRGLLVKVLGEMAQAVARGEEIPKEALAQVYQGMKGGVMRYKHLLVPVMNTAFYVKARRLRVNLGARPYETMDKSWIQYKGDRS